MLEIKFINDLSFKGIHDLIMDSGASTVSFIEEGEKDVDLQYLLEIALLIKQYNPDLYLEFRTKNSEPRFIQTSSHIKFPFDEVIMF